MFSKWKKVLHRTTFLSFVVLCIFVVLFAFWMPGHYSYDDGANQINAADALFYSLITWNILCVLASVIVFCLNLFLFVKTPKMELIMEMIKELLPIILVLWFVEFKLNTLWFYFTLPLTFLGEIL